MFLLFSSALRPQGDRGGVWRAHAEEPHAEGPGGSRKWPRSPNGPRCGDEGRRIGLGTHYLLLLSVLFNRFQKSMKSLWKRSGRSTRSAKKGESTNCGATDCQHWLVCHWRKRWNVPIVFPTGSWSTWTTTSSNTTPTRTPSRSAWRSWAACSNSPSPRSDGLAAVTSGPAMVVYTYGLVAPGRGRVMDRVWRSPMRGSEKANAGLVFPLWFRV